jgi:hypothetical protein
MTIPAELQRADYDILRLVAQEGETTHRDIYGTFTRPGRGRGQVLVRRWNALAEDDLIAETDHGTYVLTERGRRLVEEPTAGAT